MKNFHSRTSHRLSEMFKEARKEGNKPDWIGTIYWKSGTCLYIGKNVIQLRKIVHQKKGEHYTHGGLLACMTTLFDWYDIFNILLYLFMIYHQLLTL